MPAHAELEPFLDDGLITGVRYALKSGKEADVYLCDAGPSTGRKLLAAKVYRPRHHRDFKDDSMYRAGQVITKRRERTAVEKKTRFGRQLDHALWVDREREAPTTLHAAGVDVPEPFGGSESAILMGYVGDEDGPAPQLRHVDLDAREARELYERVVWNLETMLANNLVHGDLSPYNILWWEGDITIIDLPQAVDPRRNPNAHDLLVRDVQNVTAFFSRFGVRTNADALAHDQWMRFLFADL
ncbi:MAG: serine protein kinase RIO [Actinomycetota bacterium]|nr:serine protein kinase RIO [Actinomycetota bacterium]